MHCVLGAPCSSLHAQTISSSSCSTEVCDGSSKQCPPDAFLPNGSKCRDPQHQCDYVDVCTGTSPACPDAVTDNAYTFL